MRTKGLTLVACLAGMFSALPAQAGDLEEGAKLYAAKEYSKALPILERAAQFSPMSWQPHYYLANTNLALGRMAAAKYEYELCQKTCTNQAIIARCKEGILRADKHSSQVRSTSSSSSSSSSSGSSSSEADGDKPAEKLSYDQIANNRRKDDIMKLAKEEVAKIRKEAKEQIEHEKANANQYYQFEDGRVGTDIPDEREAEINREAETKCKKVMEDAERRARSIK